MGIIAIKDFECEERGPIISIGLAESPSEDGRNFIFQCDLRNNDFPAVSNWPEGETYCVTDTVGRTSYGGVVEASIDGNVLRVVFNEKTTRILELREAEWDLIIDNQAIDIERLRKQLGRVLSCGRPEFRPRVLGLG